VSRINVCINKSREELRNTPYRINPNSHGHREQVPLPDWERLGIEKKDTMTDIQKSLGLGGTSTPDERCQ
jgi:hypothetical protein